ncbi:MAG: DUF1926 domain-containing protein [Planctomycetaceae bacterium]|nr:DUF1926 domain-containing protein [Planctomycetaceae bacterium]
MMVGLDRQPVCNATGPRSAVAQLQHRWQFLTRRLQTLQRDGHDEPTLAQAKWHLYCASYHSGALPSAEPPVDSAAFHAGAQKSSDGASAWNDEMSADVQQSIRRNLIEADNLLDEFSGRAAETVDALLYDFDGDGEAEVRLANSQLMAWLAPAAGGQLFGLDARSVGQNVLASGLPSFLEYFWYPQIQSGEVQDFLNRADHSFANRSYHGKLRQGQGRMQILLQQQATVHDLPLRVSKALTMLDCSDELEITYLIEGLPEGVLLNFGSLWHWAGIGSDVTNRFVHDLAGHRLGSCQRPLYLPQSSGVGLCDVWSGIDLQLKTPSVCRLVVSPTPQSRTSAPGSTTTSSPSTKSSPTPTTPTTPSSTAPYLAVMPHWIISGDAQGRWSTKFSLRVDPTPTDIRKSRT